MISVRRYCSRNRLLNAGSSANFAIFSWNSSLVGDNGSGFSGTAPRTRINLDFRTSSNGFLFGFERFSLCSFYSTRPVSRSFRRRESKRRKANSKPVLDETQFQRALSQLLPRFTPEDLSGVMAQQDDPLVCFELFNWASRQPRFKHDVCTYHVAVKKLGVARMYQEMDDVVNQVLAVSHVGNEALFNTIIYFFAEARKLTRAVNIFKHMKSCRNMDCRPSIRTYNILFAAFLSRGSNSYINHVYMDTVRFLFRQMVSDGIEPDIFSLNSMVKGYVLSLHVNDALRIFHQMGVVYSCQPNSCTYDYLIHGLCAQSRTNNAMELCDEMKSKGFVPSGKSYNSLVNALVLAGEVDEALKFLWEMIKQRRSADFITYKTVLDETCRRGRVGEAVKLLKEFREKDLVDGLTYRKLLYVIEDDFGHSTDQSRCRLPPGDILHLELQKGNNLVERPCLALFIPPHFLNICGSNLQNRIKRAFFLQYFSPQELQIPLKSI